MTQMDERIDREVRALRVGGYLRLVGGMIVAIFVAVMISYYSQRDNLIAGCIRNSASKAIDVRFFLDAAAARGKTDPAVASEYTQRAQEKADVIPLPNGVAHTTKAISVPNNRVLGCQDAFPAPIPGLNIG